MSRRGGTRIRATRRPVVVLAGEDRNDRRCLRILLEAFCEEMRGRLVEINEPVAVEEMEAWLLLFPDALSDLVGSWKLPAKYRGKDTGRLTDPKGIFMREVSKGGRRYRESDAPAVLERVVALAIHREPIGSNRTWTRLGTDIADCCSRHLKQPTKTR